MYVSVHVCAWHVCMCVQVCALGSAQDQWKCECKRADKCMCAGKRMRRYEVGMQVHAQGEGGKQNVWMCGCSGKIVQGAEHAQTRRKLEATHISIR